MPRVRRDIVIDLALHILVWLLLQVVIQALHERGHLVLFHLGDQLQDVLAEEVHRALILLDEVETFGSIVFDESLLDVLL